MTTSGSNQPALLALCDVEKAFPARRGWSWRRPAPVRAVAGVSFELRSGAALGLVGESGSGKSTLARLVLGLDHPSSGDVLLRGRRVADWLRQDPRAFRRAVQFVPQDPVAALNPRKTIEASLHAPLIALTKRSAAERAKLIQRSLEHVDLERALLARYPHELSGGQAQRVNIARALIVEPTLVVLDEAVAALDVTVRAQVLALLAELRDEQGLAYLFISHDLAVVDRVCDEVVVLRRGRVVEGGSARRVLGAPGHEYTRELLRAVPRLGAQRRKPQAG
jgi:peptide/nickel transport system ATP-binding protein